MKLKEYKVLGHKVNYNVTETSEEFNKLDPKRSDAANDEAVANIVYRSMNPDTRYTFLHGREAVAAKDGEAAVAGIEGVEAQAVALLPGIADVERKTEEVKGKDGKVRMKDGVAVTRFDEAEEAYYNRVLALLVENKKFASEDAAREHFQSLIADIALSVPFDPTASEGKERGPKKLAAKYKLAAAKVIAIGNVESVNTNQLSKISKTFTASTPAEGDKMFEGSYEEKQGDNIVQVPFKVSDKDAETLGWLIKEYFDWKSTQELATL